MIEEAKRFHHHNSQTFMPDSSIRTKANEIVSSSWLGKLGEIAVCSCYHRLAINDESFEHDLIILGQRIEIKTKKCSSPPHGDYLCSVAKSSAFQKPDYYCFVRIRDDLAIGWILGFISHARFYEIAFFKRAGELDKNGWSFKRDCFNIEAKNLSFREFPPPQDCEHSAFLSLLFQARS